MTHTCNLRTWAAEARELLQIWGQLGLHRECPTTLDHMWSKALPLWCGIVNKEDSSPRCACHAPLHYSLVGVALPPERNPFQLGRSTAGGPGRLAVPVPLEVTLLITPLFWQSLCENTIWLEYFEQSLLLRVLNLLLCRDPQPWPRKFSVHPGVPVLLRGWFRETSATWII